MRYLLIIALVIWANHAVSQVLTQTGDLFSHISLIIGNIPGNTGNDYQSPSQAELMTFGNALSLLLDGDSNQSADSAALLGYTVTEYFDTQTNQTYYVLEAASSNHWGTYVYNPNYCRSLVIQAPHPKKDFNTGLEGMHVFLESNALFFMVSGTSRCNSDAYSTCSGTTSVCSGSSESYRISDLAHILDTPFQSTTDTLFQRFNDSYFLQLHGFGRDPGEPYVILSNGTTITPATDYIVPLETHLKAEDPFFDDSIVVAHVDLTWTQLRGFGNVQGRLINNSSDHCSDNATATNGRFIHMEQEKTRLRDDSTGWSKVSTAVKNTFPCATNATPEFTSNKKTRIMVLDYLGRETEDQPNTLLIYVYDDGSVEKVFRVE